MTTGPDKFTWNVQLAGYINYQDFIKEFDSFPRLDQIKKANLYPDKVSPPISIKNLKTGMVFWVSMSSYIIN